MKNAIIKICSNYSSSDYQTQTDLSSTLEAAIATEI